MSLKNRSLLRGTNANARPENHDLKMTDKLAKKLGEAKSLVWVMGAEAPGKRNSAAQPRKVSMHCVVYLIALVNCAAYFLIVHRFICHDPRPRKAATGSAGASDTFHIFFVINCPVLDN